MVFQGLLQWNLNMFKDSHSTTWYKSLIIWAVFSWCLPLRPLESSQKWNLLDWSDIGLWLWVPVPSLKQTWICRVGLNLVVFNILFNSNYSVIYVWKFFKNCFQVWAWFFTWFFWNGYTEKYYWSWTLSFYSFPTHKWLLLMGMWHMATTTENLLFVCWCFVWAGSLGWQILKQPCLVWTSTDKAKSITGYFLQY